MKKVNYNLIIAQWSVNSNDDPKTEFIELETNLSLDSPGDVCHVSVYAPVAAQGGMLEGLAAQAAGSLGLGGNAGGGAFSVQVRGNAIKYDDKITIELSSGDASDKVMTAEVQKVDSSFGITKIVGRTGTQKLVNTRINQVYENQTLNQIVNDFAGQAGVNIGSVDTGSTYPYLVIHESKSVWQYSRELAMREGMDIYFDTENKLNMKKYNKTGADHTFFYGIDILDLEVFNNQMNSEHIMVYGESPASKQGTDTWHWIAKDISPFQSEVGQGAKTQAFQDGTLRTKEAADSLATSKYGAISDNSTWGRLKILGNPKVKLADAIEIKNAEKPEMNGLFKVTSVRHILNKQDGYLAFINFTRLGGSSQAGGLLGQASKQLAGAIGI